MIVTSTPFRITLGGGGTDLPSYYGKHGGFVFSMAINRYMFLMVNPPSVDRKIRLHYSQSEQVDHLDDLKHELAREALRWVGIDDAIEVASMADLPAGTGLGSSSCYLVGLLAALNQYNHHPVPPQKLAEDACAIELDVLKKGIGKQDQYMAAFGGMRLLNISRDGAVKVEDASISQGVINDLISNSHIYYTGHQRSALEILAVQDNAMKSAKAAGHNVVETSLHQIRDLGERIYRAISDGDIDQWGLLLHEHWLSKKAMSSSISIPFIDKVYEDVRERFNVLGGKIIGAGGGGFLMLYAPTKHQELEAFMAELGMPRLHYAMEPEGVRVVANLTGRQSVRPHRPDALAAKAYGI